MTDLHGLSAEELRERVITVGGGPLALPAFEELVTRAKDHEAVDRVTKRMRAAEARLAEAEKTLEFYANERNYRPDGAGWAILEADKGRRARAAIAAEVRHATALMQEQRRAALAALQEGKKP